MKRRHLISQAVGQCFMDFNLHFTKIEKLYDDEYIFELTFNKEIIPYVRVNIKIEKVYQKYLLDYHIVLIVGNTYIREKVEFGNLYSDLIKTLSEMRNKEGIVEKLLLIICRYPKS